MAGVTGNEPRDPQALKSLYAKRVIVRQVNLDSGQFVAPGEDTAGQKGCGEPAVAQNPTPIRQRCPRAVVYLIRNNDNEIQQVILPFYGKGAKSMMYGLIALATDGRTVKDLLYYQQNETPLLGARVTDPEWRRQWPGKKIRDNNGQPALKVVQNTPGQHDDYTVDGISGATLTSSASRRVLIIGWVSRATVIFSGSYSITLRYYAVNIAQAKICSITGAKIAPVFFMRSRQLFRASQASLTR